MIKDKLGLVEILTSQLRAFTDIAVIPMSGGVDSTVVATTLMLALGPENVYGIHMPYNETDNKDGKFNSNSRKIADKLGIKSLDIPIFDATAAINRGVTSALAYGESIDELGHVNGGNTRSRVRMCMAYGVCHELARHTGKRCRVIGTGNLSEDYIGYDTKGGDALADIFPIGELYKSEVYELAEFYANEGYIEHSMIDRTPSAGLWDGQTDEGELGYSYNEMETSIRKLRSATGGLAFPIKAPHYTALDHFVHDRHVNNLHKHMAPPVIELRVTKLVD